MLAPTTINIIFIFLLVDLSNLIHIIDKTQFSVYWQSLTGTGVMESMLCSK